MILQRIVFPQNRCEETAALYYKSTKNINLLTRHSVELPPDCSLSLFSYFNSFSAFRWNTYTSVSTIAVHLIISGTGTARLVHQTRTTYQQILEQEFSSDKDTQLLFHINALPREGFFYLEITSAENASVMLKSGYFSSENAEPHKTHIAVATCTFRREAYIEANIKRIRQDIFENAESELKKYLNIYIIDNGQTLSSDQFSDFRIRLIPNANTGGSGGFTRGLIEILHDKATNFYTHALLMDDDIELDTESLERTFSFLCCLKEEYLESTVGGAMLRNDTPY